MRRLTVVGGSSPFSVGLVDAIVERGETLATHELVLQGRSADRLKRIGSYARERLEAIGWRVRESRRLDEALDGCDVVLQQARYGGLELRAEGEELCARHGVPADETLGPAALLCALRIREELDRFAAAVRRHAPRAWVLNLTNPLAPVTARLAAAGLRVLGLCELPAVTHLRLAALLELEPDRLRWSYSGLNHRGFLHTLRDNGEDQIEPLLDRLQGRPFEGIAAATIERMRAVPTKYFRLIEEPRPEPIRRAAALAELRRRIVGELSDAPGVSPPSLLERYMDWYPRSVVPLLETLAAAAPGSHVVNLCGSDGVVREVRGQVDADGVRVEAGGEAPREVESWMQRFERHERAVLAAIERPDRPRIEQALALDPTVTSGSVAAIAAELCAS